MGIKMKWYIHKYLPIKSLTQVRLCKWLLKMKSTCKWLKWNQLWVTNLPWTHYSYNLDLGRDHHPLLYSILWTLLCQWYWNDFLSWDSQVGSWNSQVVSIATLHVHNLFIWVPIKDLPSTKLWPLTRLFQHCVVHFH
jgi:hypothetical protein